MLSSDKKCEAASASASASTSALCAISSRKIVCARDERSFRCVARKCRRASPSHNSASASAHVLITTCRTPLTESPPPFFSHSASPDCPLSRSMITSL